MLLPEAHHSSKHRMEVQLSLTVSHTVSHCLAHCLSLSHTLSRTVLHTVSHCLTHCLPLSHAPPRSPPLEQAPHGGTPRSLQGYLLPGNQLQGYLAHKRCYPLKPTTRASTSWRSFSNPYRGTSLKPAGILHILRSLDPEIFDEMLLLPRA